MSCANCNCTPCTCGTEGCCGTSPASSNCPPSPEPPWARPVQSPLTQTLSAAGSVSLTNDTTYLVATVAVPSAPIAITLPDGNYKRQFKRIMIPGANLATTETFNLSGTFAGFTSLTFNGIGFNAVLEWDGAAWQFISGNAVTNA